MTAISILTKAIPNIEVATPAKSAIEFIVETARLPIIFFNVQEKTRLFGCHQVRASLIDDESLDWRHRCIQKKCRESILL